MNGTIVMMRHHNEVLKISGKDNAYLYRATDNLTKKRYINFLLSD